MEFGATFSHRHLRHLNLDPLSAIRAYKTLRFSWIRICCYWDEIEQSPGTCSFAAIDPLLAYCSTHGIDVVLTVGMKAPRYPEYYIPSWLTGQVPFGHRAVIDGRNRTLVRSLLSYIAATIRHVRHHKAVKVYQIENEPLDPSGPLARSIDRDLLEEEVRLVRSLDTKRNILTTLWGNDAKGRNNWPYQLALSDIIGMDLYYRQAVSFPFGFARTYVGPVDSVTETANIIATIRRTGKTAWITELQAEPWEHTELIPASARPPSYLPEHAAVMVRNAALFAPPVMLLWGFEWWYHRKMQGDSAYWRSIRHATNFALKRR